MFQKIWLFLVDPDTFDGAAPKIALLVRLGLAAFATAAVEGHFNEVIPAGYAWTVKLAYPVNMILAGLGIKKLGNGKKVPMKPKRS